MYTISASLSCKFHLALVCSTKTQIISACGRFTSDFAEFLNCLMSIAPFSLKFMGMEFFSDYGY